MISRENTEKSVIGGQILQFPGIAGTGTEKLIENQGRACRPLYWKKTASLYTAATGIVSTLYVTGQVTDVSKRKVFDQMALLLRL